MAKVVEAMRPRLGDSNLEISKGTLGTLEDTLQKSSRCTVSQSLWERFKRGTMVSMVYNFASAVFFSKFETLL